VRPLFLGGGGGERKRILLLEGSQAIPARPSDKNRIRVKDVRVINSERLITETAEF
jgi:hypothetical protein